MVLVVTAFKLVIVGGSNAVCYLWRGPTVLASVFIVTMISYQRLYNPNKFSCYAPAEAAPRRRSVTDCGREVTVRSHRW